MQGTHEDERPPVVRAINRWWRFLPESCRDFRELLNATKKTTFTYKVKDAITEAYCWAMWKGRNDVVFKGKVSNMLITANDIQSVVYSWVRYRSSNGRSVRWQDWVCNPESL